MSSDNSHEFIPADDDTPDQLLEKRLIRVEAEAAILREQYNLLYNDYMVVLSGADAVLRSIGDPLVLEEIYTMVADKDTNLALLFRPLVDMITEFNFNFIEVTDGGFDE
jgi:hypothetical protein